MTLQPLISPLIDCQFKVLFKGLDENVSDFLTKSVDSIKIIKNKQNNKCIISFTVDQNNKVLDSLNSIYNQTFDIEVIRLSNGQEVLRRHYLHGSKIQSLEIQSSYSNEAALVIHVSMDCKYIIL